MLCCHKNQAPRTVRTAASLFCGADWRTCLRLTTLFGYPAAEAAGGGGFRLVFSSGQTKGFSFGFR